MYKVLIVDDEYFIREGLKQLIDWSEYGIEIAGDASDGKEALSLVDIHKPDIIITDIVMPEMRGLELVKTLRKSNINTKIIIMSGYDEFDFVKESMLYGVENYLLKPIDEGELSLTLLNTIEKLEAERKEKIETRRNEYVIRDSILNRLVFNTIHKDDLLDRLNTLGIDLDGNNFAVSVGKITDDEIVHEGQAVSDISKIRFNALDIWNTEFFANNTIDSLSFYDLNGNVVIIFYGYSINECMDKIEDIMQSWAARVEKSLKTRVSVSIGPVVDTIDSIHESYREAVSLEDYFVIYQKSDNVVRYDKLMNNSKDVFSINIDNLTQYILENNKPEINDFFNQIYKRSICSNNLTSTNIEWLAFEIFSSLVRLVKAEGIKVDEILDEIEPPKKKVRQQTVPEMVAWLISLGEVVADKMAKQKNKNQTFIQKIIEYVEQHYNEPLSLKVLACKFHISAPYLGQLFKQETGKLFSDYLHHLRIERARELLGGPNFKASEIAERVGYEDTNYFYKIFKKYTGVYPAEYMKKK